MVKEELSVRGRFAEVTALCAEAAEQGAPVRKAT